LKKHTSNAEVGYTVGKGISQSYVIRKRDEHKGYLVDILIPLYCHSTASTSSLLTSLDAA